MSRWIDPRAVSKMDFFLKRFIAYNSVNFDVTKKILNAMDSYVLADSSIYYRFSVLLSLPKKGSSKSSCSS